jgi:DNA-binding IclR family transcriptional regulator
MPSTTAAAAASTSPSTPPPDHRDFGGNRATARVLLVLSQFTDGRPSHGVSELSRELGMTKNMVHRALKILARYGYLVRDESGTRYQLGPGVLQLGRFGLEPLNLPRLADPYMHRMQEISEETVSLAVRAGRTAVTLAGLRGRGDIARRVPFGRSVPLHASPAARTILASLPDEEIEEYVSGPLERFTPTTPATPTAVWDDVREIRARGYALGLGEHVRATMGIGFPILASDGSAHGSLTIAGPLGRLPEDRVERIVPPLLEVMAELNRRSQLYPADLLAQPAPTA